MAKGLAGTSLISDANLIAYYKLEDVNDSKGSNTLTNNGSGSFSAARFDNGYDQGTANATKYLSVSSNLGIAGNADISVSFWVKLNAEIASGNWTLSSHNSNLTANGYFDLEYQYNAGTRRFQVDTSGTSFSVNTTIGTSAFHHIVYTRNVSGNTATLYYDNSSIGTSAVGVPADPGNIFGMGAFRAGSNISAACLFDDVAVFNRVLSSGEVTTIYNSPTTDTTGASFLFNFI